MDHRNGLESYDYDMNQFHDVHTSDTSHLFPAYGPDGLPIQHGFTTGPYFAGDLGDVDENDPKRRRIARVRSSMLPRCILLTSFRHAICVARKRSNVTVRFIHGTPQWVCLSNDILTEIQVNCPSVVIAPTTRPNAYLLMLKRKGTHLKGTRLLQKPLHSSSY